MARLHSHASFIQPSSPATGDTSFGYTLEIGHLKRNEIVFVHGLVPIGFGHLDREVFKRISIAPSDLYYEHHSTRLD